MRRENLVGNRAQENQVRFIQIFNLPLITQKYLQNKWAMRRKVKLFMFIFSLYIQKC